MQELMRGDSLEPSGGNEKKKDNERYWMVRRSTLGSQFRVHSHFKKKRIQINRVNLSQHAETRIIGVRKVLIVQLVIQYFKVISSLFTTSIIYIKVNKRISRIRTFTVQSISQN